MQHYYVNEAAFALPAWPLIDRTLQRLTAPLAGAEDPLTVEIRRVPMEPGKSLRQLVDEAIEADRANDNGYSVVDTAEAALDGAPALLLRARLRARDSVYLKLQAHVALGDVWLAFVVTGPSTHRAACEETFDRLVRGLRWRRG
jgi:hypothetical protein